MPVTLSQRSSMAVTLWFHKKLRADKKKFYLLFVINFVSAGLLLSLLIRREYDCFYFEVNFLPKSETFSLSGDLKRTTCSTQAELSPCA